MSAETQSRVTAGRNWRQNSKGTRSAWKLRWALSLWVFGGVILLYAYETRPELSDDERVLRVTRALDSSEFIQRLSGSLGDLIAPTKNETRSAPSPTPPKPQATPNPAPEPKQRLQSATLPKSEAVTLTAEAATTAIVKALMATVASAPPEKLRDAETQLSALVKESLGIFEREFELYISEARRSRRLTEAGLALITLGTILFIGHLLTYYGASDDEFVEPSGSNERLNEVVSALRYEAKRLQVEARQLIAVIFGVCAGGLSMFYFATELSYEGKAANSNLSNVGSFFQTNETVIQGAIKEVFDKCMSESAFANDAATASALAQIEVGTVTQLGDVVKSEASLRELFTSLNRNVLISSILARSGLLLIIGYLIRILLSAYKYDTRLSALYSSRAYALALTPAGKLPHLSELMKVLEPSDLDFESITTAPSLEARKPHA